MTGLEKIQEKILAQSKINCDQIVSKANEEAKKWVNKIPSILPAEKDFTL